MDNEKDWTLIARFFFYSALAFLLLTGVVKTLYWIANHPNFGGTSAAAEINAQFQDFLPLMAYGYFFAGMGASARYAVDYLRLSQVEKPKFDQLSATILPRLFSASTFGLISYFVLASNLFPTLLFDLHGIEGAGSADPNLSGLILIAFAIGLFSGETFDALLKRVTDT